jgi:hypothetical protein
MTRLAFENNFAKDCVKRHEIKLRSDLQNEEIQDRFG